MTLRDVSKLSVEDRWMYRTGLSALGVCGAGFSLVRAVEFSRTMTSGAERGFSVRKGGGGDICVITSASILRTTVRVNPGHLQRSRKVAVH